MAAGGVALATRVGQLAISDTGKRLLWDGAKYIAEKLWNKKWRQGKIRDVIGHPGAMPGAVAAPVAISRIVRSSKPRFKKGNGSVTVTHRELIGTFNNSTGLVVNSGVTGNQYRLNPANAVLFPWLQTLASNFDQYRFDNVRLQYVPLCGTSTTGRVALLFDKDSQDELPADRVELANIGHLTETSPWAEASLRIPTDSNKRFTADNATSDPKLIDLGQVGIATYGSTGTDPAGDVFIHYTVTFFEPQPSSGVLSTLRLNGSIATSGGPALFATASTATALAISFKSPGIYFIALSLNCTTFISTTTVDTTINSASTMHNGTSRFLAMYNITVTRVNGGVTINGTAIGNYNVSATRAKLANDVGV